MMNLLEEIIQIGRFRCNFVTHNVKGSAAARGQRAAEGGRGRQRAAEGGRGRQRSLLGSSRWVSLFVYLFVSLFRHFFVCLCGEALVTSLKPAGGSRGNTMGPMGAGGEATRGQEGEMGPAS